MRPAPIAAAKEANTSLMISTSPVSRISTPGGRVSAVGKAWIAATAAPSGEAPRRSPSMVTRRVRSSRIFAPGPGAPRFVKPDPDRNQPIAGVELGEIGVYVAKRGDAYRIG